MVIYGLDIMYLAKRLIYWRLDPQLEHHFWDVLEALLGGAQLEEVSHWG
jgi:hypothetical protein